VNPGGGQCYLVSRLAVCPGSKLKVTIARRKLEAKEGWQGSISTLLVEANKGCFRGKNRSPEAFTDLPGWW
jgi:hypothetical protein